MFVSTARVRLVGMPDRDKKKKELSRKKRAARRNLKIRDLLRMPCLLPTCASCLLGFFVLMGGTAMSIVAYHPAFVDPYVSRNNETWNTTTTQNLRAVYLQYALNRPTAMKILSYIGPVFMGFGLFTMIVAGVLYCEFVDKYVTISTEKQRSLKKKVLYDMIIEQLRKNYFRGLEIPPNRPKIANIAPKVKQTSLSRCLSISSPLLSPVTDTVAETHSEDKPEVLQSPTDHVSRLKVLQKENWIKTSSLPNIKPDAAETLKLDVLCSSTEKYLMTKRLSKSCGNVVDMFSMFGSCSSRVGSSGIVNLAYTPDQQGGQTIGLSDLPSQSSLHSRMTSQEASCENVRGEAMSRECSELDNVSKPEALAHGASVDEDTCSNSRNDLFFNNDCDSSIPRAKHVSVIIHQAYVHQPADACDLNMQISNVKKLYNFPENKNGADLNNRDISNVVQHGALIGVVSDVSEPLLSNHVSIAFDEESSNWSDCVTQSDGDEGDSVDMCQSVLL